MVVGVVAVAGETVIIIAAASDGDKETIVSLRL
jgi:hypothetical protein